MSTNRHIWAGRLMHTVPPAEDHVREAIYAHDAITWHVDKVACLVLNARRRKLSYATLNESMDSWEADLDQQTVEVTFEGYDRERDSYTFPLEYLWHPDPWQAEMDRLNAESRAKERAIQEASEWQEFIERLRVRQEIGA